MIKLLTRLAFLVIIVAVAVYSVSTLWPDWWKKPIIPPLPVSNDCSVVETEIARYDWDKDIALAIAKAESACDASARGDEDRIYQERGRDYGYSVGVFQVRILPGREACDNYNVATNVKCAYNIYKESGWKAWSVYENEAYERYMWRGLDKLF